MQRLLLLFQKKHLGTFGDISTFSFFGSKTITTGEGMVVTNNKRLAKIIYKLKKQFELHLISIIGMM